MSGASALAAAKRRRGISSQPPPRPGSTRGPPPRPPTPNGPPRGVPSPMQLLENHHSRLKIIESNVESMVEIINALEARTHTDAPSQVNDPELAKNIMRLEAKLVVLEERLLIKNTEEPEEDIAFFKSKISEVQLEMAELKQHVLKIQTFAMETNLALMKERQQKLDDEEAAEKAVEEDTEEETEKSQEDSEEAA
tara:strand:- start:4865 stop:5449 length:585 start_codon:yes stop_codon:yes gene_type:complete